MNNNTNQCVVAGGGVIGIVVAILLSEKYDNVTVIEKGKELGGLLNCCQDEAGNYYDYGTHIPAFTNIPELDTLLYGDKDEIDKDWVIMDPLRSQNYLNGQWNRKSCLLDARSLEKEKYEKGLLEMFQLGEFDPMGLNLAEYVLKTFGVTFTKELYYPVIEKLFGVDPDKLEPLNSLNYFGLTRLIVLNPESTKILKKIKFFDNKIGFHESGGLLSKPHLYPNSPRGSGYWIDSLVAKAKEKGVIFRTGASIDKIELDGKEVKSIEISGLGNMNCDLLVWTVPPFMAFKAAGLEYNYKRPILRTTTIFHYCVDKELLIKEVPFVWCFDPKYTTFRITLYPNMNPQKSEEGYTITAEVLTSAEEAKDLDDEKIFKELIDLEIIDKSANILSKTKQIYPNTFPVPEMGFTDTAVKIADSMKEQMTNTLLLGRSSGKVWFMIHGLIQVYEEVSAMRTIKKKVKT